MMMILQAKVDNLFEQELVMIMFKQELTRKLDEQQERVVAGVARLRMTPSFRMVIKNDQIR